jgi:hypothetical protein
MQNESMIEKYATFLDEQEQNVNPLLRKRRATSDDESEEMSDETQCCTGCGEEKSSNNFYMNGKKRRARCKSCHIKTNKIAYENSKQARLKNPKTDQEDLTAKKNCTGCGKEKLVTEFYRTCGRRMAKCKICDDKRHVALRAKNARTLLENPEDTSAKKTCSGCGQAKVVTEFHSEGGGRRRGKCRICEAKQRKSTQTKKRCLGFRPQDAKIKHEDAEEEENAEEDEDAEEEENAEEDEDAEEEENAGQQRKTCNTCRQGKLMTEFYRDGGRRRSICKVCESKRKKVLQAKKRKIEIDRTGKKTCSKCEQAHPKTDFTVNLGHKDSLSAECVHCERKHRQELRDYILKRRSELGPCWNCKETNVFLLQFDHTNNKIMAVAKMRTKEQIDAEIKKCVVRCVKCHREKTLKDLAKRPRKVPTTKKRIQNAKYETDNRKYVNDMKRKIGACAHCHLKIPDDEIGVSLYDFDHIDRSQKHKCIGQLLTGGRKTLDIELKKCQLLCVSCHMLKTALDMHWYNDRHHEQILTSFEARAQRNGDKKK